MSNFLFDLECKVAVRVDASSRRKAYEMIAEALECADANLGAWPNGDPITAELSMCVARCAEQDGDRVGLTAREIRQAPTRHEMAVMIRALTAILSDDYSDSPHEAPLTLAAAKSMMRALKQEL
jgi:hypothetical protein